IIQRGRAVRAGGGGEFKVAYCKTDAPDGDEITCYLDNDVLEYDAGKTYSLNEWCEDPASGGEYKSLQNNNTAHPLSDGDWWEAGSVSVTVKCLIANGSSLMYAGPFLKDGQPIPVGKRGDEWLCTNLFSGARFMPLPV
ncbi:MAG: hypothetical protein DRP66_11575, partial [Planctomycetota bacterium]